MTMGRESDISKKRVIELSKAALDRTNDCIRDTAEVQKAHNFLSQQVAKDIAELKARAASQAAWVEAGETSLNNTRRHLDARIDGLSAVQRDFQRLEVEQTKLLSEIVAAMPPKGFFRRLKWLVRGPAVPGTASPVYPFVEGAMPMSDRSV